VSRPLRAIIDHAALIDNLERVRVAAPDSRIMAVVKANAYGHGAVEVAHTLERAGADALAVIGCQEALRLRKAGVSCPITLLQGIYSVDELTVVDDARLDLVVHEGWQADALLRAQPARPIRVWVKVDTGMHRLGFHPDEFAGVLMRLRGATAVRQPVGLFSHLATADVAGSADARWQIERWRQLAAANPDCPTSLANSAAILGWPDAHPGWVRPGIMLYGSSPFSNGQAAAGLGLRPVMQLQSALIAVRRLQAGDRVGYGGTVVCPEAMPVGLVAGGYGDGYPRHAPSGTPVLVAGRRVPLFGRVSMDSVSVDLRTCPEARVGDPVVLWGEAPLIDEIAGTAGTIAYEPLTQVTARVVRQHRQYLDT
jgi:alanine racemase